MRIFLAISFITTVFFSFGQYRQGMVLDNYGGTISTRFNPANLADSRFQFQMNVIGVNASVQNTYIQTLTPDPLRKYALWSLDENFLKENPNRTFQEYYALERYNRKDNYVYAQGQVDYLNAQLGLNDKSGIAIHFSTKAYGHVANMPENVIKTFLQDLDTIGPVKENQERLLGQQMDASNSGAGAMAYQQLGLTYALSQSISRTDVIKFGFGIDYNIGLFGSYARFKNASYTLTGIDTLQVETSDMEFGLMDDTYYTSSDRRVNDFFGKSKLGNGIGLNVGFVYEKQERNPAFKYKMNRKNMEDRSVNKYKWRVGGSINDLGYVKFNKSGLTRKISIPNQATTLAWNDFDEVDSWKGLTELDTFANQFFNDVDTSSAFTMFTPATLNLSGDYKVMDAFYVGAIYRQSLMLNKAKGAKTPTVLSVIPRFETRWFSASLPLSFGNYYNKAALGAYIRTGIFYIGTDNLGGFVRGTKINGASVYAGFSWPIHYNRHKDADNDQVSDDIDECPTIPGTFKTQGCPDRDGDKVRDSEDQCPDEAGSKRTSGCPDSDADGLIGEADLCPDKYGAKSSDGCPDSDGDGIHDGVDNCPEKAGEKDLNGCPEIELEEATEDSTVIMIEKETSSEEKATPVIEFSKFDNWDFDNYEYWPILGAYNDIRWAEELQNRISTKLGLATNIRSIPGISRHYITLGKATNLAEAKRIQETIDVGVINPELNGEIWWKKIKK